MSVIYTDGGGRVLGPYREAVAEILREENEKLQNEAEGYKRKIKRMEENSKMHGDWKGGIGMILVVAIGICLVMMTFSLADCSSSAGCNQPSTYLENLDGCSTTCDKVKSFRRGDHNDYFCECQTP